MKERNKNLPGYNVYPLKGAVEMHKLQRRARQHLSKITQPTLVLIGGQDRTIAPNAAYIVLDGVKSAKKQHVHLQESGHVILLDKELAQAFQIVMEFIQQKSPHRL